MYTGAEQDIDVEFLLQNHTQGEKSVEDNTRTVSRRKLLKSAANLTAVGATTPQARSDDDDDRLDKKGTVLAYIGTYTPNGGGIYLYQVNLANGALTKIKLFPSTVNPSWIAF